MKLKMGNVVTLAAAAALIGVLPLFAQTPAPTPVQKPDFILTLPPAYAAFTEQTQSMKQGEGTIQMTTYVSKNTTTNEAAVVTVSKMPGKIGDPDKAFASTRDGLLKSLNATLEKEEKLPGDVASERLVFRSNTAPVFLQARLIAKDNRLVQLLYVGRSEEQRNSPGTAQLFDSFHLVDAPAPAASK